MALISLIDAQSCVDFFREGILITLRYWQDHAAVKAVDIQALDQERAGIIRVIALAFEVDEAWPLLRELVVTLSPYMERRGDWEMWRWVLSRAIDMARRVDDPAGTITLTLLLARLLQRQSELSLAITRYRQTIRLARQVGDDYTRARACSNLGFLYSERGYWWRAEILCYHALAIFEKLNSNHGRAHTENHLGIVYIWQHRWDLAQQHLERACAIWQTMGDNDGLLLGLANLGALYDDREYPDQALLYLDQALHLAELTGKELQRANITMNMGVAYRLKGDLATAERLIWQAEAIFRRLYNAIGLAQVQDNLGLVCIDLGRLPEAKAHLQAAEQAWHKLGNKYGAIRTLTYLLEYELARKSQPQASRYLARIERLIALAGKEGQAPHWQDLLTKCCRSLAAYMAHPAAAD